MGIEVNDFTKKELVRLQCALQCHKDEHGDLYDEDLLTKVIDMILQLCFHNWSLKNNIITCSKCHITIEIATCQHTTTNTNA